jgi:hypothetical protein
MRTDAEGAEPSGGPSRLLRAYAVTGGRTRPRHAELELESLVSTTELGVRSATTLEMERGAIALLCMRVLSIAEVSAHLDLALGVTRVLVGDMAAEGLLSVNRPADPAAAPDVALLERVLLGLRALSPLPPGT